MGVIKRGYYEEKISTISIIAACGSVATCARSAVWAVRSAARTERAAVCRLDSRGRGYAQQLAVGFPHKRQGERSCAIQEDPYDARLRASGSRGNSPFGLRGWECVLCPGAPGQAAFGFPCVRRDVGYSASAGVEDGHAARDGRDSRVGAARRGDG